MRRGPERRSPALRPWWLALLLVQALFCLSACRRGEKPQARPNIVLVVIDTLRADHLPFYGYRSLTAPFLSELAAQGVVFESCYSTSSYTSPATASILTSLYPFQHGVHKGLIVTLNQQAEDPTLRLNRIPQPVLTMSEWLQAAGYRTFAVADNLNIGEAEGFTQGFLRFSTMNNRGADQVNRQVKLWKREMLQAAPYFLYVHYMDPHAPYLARQPWHVAGADELQEQKARYDSEIRFVDERLRELFAELSWDENTILVITADHGEEFLEHGQTGHGKTLYNEVLRVPLLFWRQAPALGPRRVTEAVSTLDIMPTIGAMLGLAAERNFSGISLWPFARPAAPAEPRVLFATLLASRPGRADIALRATLWDRWKLIVSGEESRELFDIRAHPRERINQYGSIETQAIAAKLNGLFLSFQSRCPVFPQETSERRIDPELLAELKTLGYVR